MSGDPRWIRRLDAIYGFALRLYPRRFRAHWEQPMRQAFRDRCREVARGQRRPSALLTELLPDFALGVGRERFNELGEGSMTRRNLLLALLVLFAATIALQDRIGSAGTAALEWWQQQRDHAHAEAEREYWTRLAEATAPQRTPRDHTLAAIAWQMAGLGSAALPADPEARARAQQAFDAAIAGGDPAAFWLAATDCPVRHCDAAAAIAGLERIAPDNAAVGTVALAHAAESGDAAAQAHAWDQLAAARYYHGYDADLMAALLDIDRRARAPGHVADADQLVAGAAMAWALPDPRPLVEACRPGTGDAALCRGVARVLASGNSLLSQIVGLKLWNRFATPGVEAAEVRRRIRNLHWMLANQDLSPDAAARALWRQTWLEGGGEVAVLQAGMRARGIPLDAPDSLKLDPGLLSPDR